jgi:GNAT superfamily N-acetyltransferase
MIFREVELRDRDVVCDFLLAMIQELASVGGHSIVEEGTAAAWFNERITSGVDDPEHLFLLAESDPPDAAPLGVIEATIIRPHPVFKPKRILHIHSVFVDPDFRRKGIGRQLLETALLWGEERGCVEAVLNSLVGNPALDLYESLGFKVFELELRRKI